MSAQLHLAPDDSQRAGVELGKGDYVGSRGPITEKIQSAFFDIVNGRNPKYAGWLSKV